MQTVKRHALEGVLALSDTDPAERADVARAHAALFPARLALARLGSGAGLPHLHDAAGAHAPLRARWLADAQRNFQAWLDSGGFVQQQDDASWVGPAPLAGSTDTEQDNACID